VDISGGSLVNDEFILRLHCSVQLSVELLAY